LHMIFCVELFAFAAQVYKCSKIFFTICSCR
jgi:hypothetical protein